VNCRACASKLNQNIEITGGGLLSVRGREEDRVIQGELSVQAGRGIHTGPGTSRNARALEVDVKDRRIKLKTAGGKKPVDLEACTLGKGVSKQRPRSAEVESGRSILSGDRQHSRGWSKSKRGEDLAGKHGFDALHPVNKDHRHQMGPPKSWNESEQ